MDFDLGKKMHAIWSFSVAVILAVSTIVFAPLLVPEYQGAQAQSDRAVLICDEPSDARASRFGDAGRAYPCYTLERAVNLTFGRATLHCDEEGPAYAARSGRSGRYHACYVLGQITEFRVRGTTITCDIDHGRDSTRLGLSGRRYDCYALQPLPDSAR